MSDEVKFVVAVGKNKEAKVFHDYSSQYATPAVKSKEKPTVTDAKVTDLGMNTHVKWGKNDKRPTDVRKKLQDSGVPAAALWKKVALTYGQGIVWYDPSDGVDGGVTPVYKQEVDDFMFKNRIEDLFLPAIIYDFEVYDGNFFCEIGFDKEKKKITNLWHKSAEYCRLISAKKTEKATHLVYSAKFPDFAAKDGAKLPLLDFHDPLNTIYALKSKKKFAFHGFIPSPGKVFYATSPKSGIFKENGWLDYTNGIPATMKSMQDHQIILQYLIRIPSSYFELKYNGSAGADKSWNEMSHIEQATAIEAKRVEIETFLVGKENWFKSLTSVFYEDVESGATGAKIEIEAIDNTYKDGIWIPDANAALTIILQAMGMPPELMSLSNSDKLKPESGSNKRVAFNTNVQMNTIEQKIILYILQLVSRVNKWGLIPAFRHSMATTMDFSKSGVQDEGMV